LTQYNIAIKLKWIDAFIPTGIEDFWKQPFQATPENIVCCISQTYSKAGMLTCLWHGWELT